MFGNLSEDKFKEFSLKISGCEMTSPLWSSIRQRFIGKESVKDRYKSKNQTKPKKDLKSFPYEGDSFNGIIRALTRECGGNVEDKGVVLVTSTEGYGGPPKCVADLDDLNSIRYTNNEKNGFIQYDFKEKKVRPTFYSIRSRNAGKNDYHLQSWVIEGSNSGMNDWKVLDSQNNVKCLNSQNAFSTFEIKEKLNENEFYRFLRLRITGPNTCSSSQSYQICITGLEYFGLIVSN